MMLLRRMTIVNCGRRLSAASSRRSATPLRIPSSLLGRPGFIEMPLRHRTSYTTSYTLPRSPRSTAPRATLLHELGEGVVGCVHPSLLLPEGVDLAGLGTSLALDELHDCLFTADAEAAQPTAKGLDDLGVSCTRVSKVHGFLLIILRTDNSLARRSRRQTS